MPHAETPLPGANPSCGGVCERGADRLFRNNGDGTFTDVTEQAGLAGAGYDTGVAIGDYDNDGYEDIFVGGVQGNFSAGRQAFAVTSSM